MALSFGYPPAGPPNSHGWLDGGARSQNPGSRVGFLFRPGGHLDPTNVWSMDSSRRADVHGAFSFLVAFNFRNSFEDFNSVFFISTFLITTFHYYYIIKLGFCDIHTSSISSLDCGLLHFACKFFPRITNSHKKISACGGQKTMKCSLRSRRSLRSQE